MRPSISGMCRRVSDGSSWVAWGTASSRWRSRPTAGWLAWSGRGDGLVSVHDATTGAELVRLVGHAAVVRSLAFAPGGRGLATGGADRTVKLWDGPIDEVSVSKSLRP